MSTESVMWLGVAAVYLIPLLLAVLYERVAVRPLRRKVREEEEKILARTEFERLEHEVLEPRHHTIWDHGPTCSTCHMMRRQGEEAAKTRMRQRGPDGKPRRCPNPGGHEWTAFYSLEGHLFERCIWCEWHQPAQRGPQERRQGGI